MWARTPRCRGCSGSDAGPDVDVDVDVMSASLRGSSATTVINFGARGRQIASARLRHRCHLPQESVSLLFAGRRGSLRERLQLWACAGDHMGFRSNRLRGRRFCLHLRRCPAVVQGQPFLAVHLLPHSVCYLTYRSDGVQWTELKSTTPYTATLQWRIDLRD
jgi:hypothetical protein